MTHDWFASTSGYNTSLGITRESIVTRKGGWSKGNSTYTHYRVVAMPGMVPVEANQFNVVPDEPYSILAAAVLASPDIGAPDSCWHASRASWSSPSIRWQAVTTPRSWWNHEARRTRPM